MTQKYLGALIGCDLISRERGDGRPRHILGFNTRYKAEETCHTHSIRPEPSGGLVAQIL